MHYQHPSAIVDSTQIGENTRIWAFVHILKDVTIGINCNICDFCFIEGNVEIGNEVTIKSGVYIWEGTKIENNVFIGPNVVFTNDLRPRSKQAFTLQGVTIKNNATIGANSTLLAGVCINENAFIGIGSVVTRDVPANALVYGNPAKIRGWVDNQGEKLQQTEDGLYKDKHNQTYKVVNNTLIKIEL